MLSCLWFVPTQPVLAWDMVKWKRAIPLCLHRIGGGPDLAEDTERWDSLCEHRIQLGENNP
jgi:hypothetical protein